MAIYFLPLHVYVYIIGKYRPGSFVPWKNVQPGYKLLYPVKHFDHWGTVSLIPVEKKTHFDRFLAMF
jgi:hypothetical protein